MGLLSCLLHVFNVLFWLIGGTMLGVGIWLVVDPDAKEYLNIYDSAGLDEIYWEIALYTMISVGAIVFLVGFLGCLGSCTENRCVLLAYSIIVIIAIILECVAITFVAIFYTDLGSDMAKGMKDDVQNKYTDEQGTDALSRSWNVMQVQLECCGSGGPGDYKGSKFASSSDENVPWTCCVLKDDISYDDASIDNVKNFDQCQAHAALAAIIIDSESLHTNGCYEETHDIMEITSIVLLSVLSAFVLFQLIGLAMACAMRHKNRDVSPKIL